MAPFSTWLGVLGGSLAAIHGVLAFQYPDCINGPLTNNTVCNVEASPSDRAAALVEVMNITEKLSNLVEYVIPPR
jgi:beta-D-xylosidase 4